MLLKPFAFAAAAAGFLVIPEVSQADEDIFRTLPIEADTFLLPPTALSQSLSVPCAQCRGLDSHLELDFAVDEGSRLTLNGFELYPNADPWHGDLIATVVKGSGRRKDKRLGYSLAVTQEGQDLDQQMEVIGVELRVIEVGNRFVEGVPAIKVNLIKDPTEQLLIGSIDVKEANEIECGSMWCRAKALFSHMIHGGKACGRHRDGHMGHHNENLNPDVSVVEGHHQHSSPYNQDPDRQARQWGKLWKNVAAYIFLPVLLGITAGVSVALFAMFICSLIVRLTALFKGKNRQQPWCARHQFVRRENTADAEKAGLMEGEEPPPEYEAESEIKN